MHLQNSRASAARNTACPCPEYASPSSGFSGVNVQAMRNAPGKLGERPFVAIAITGAGADADADADAYMAYEDHVRLFNTTSKVQSQGRIWHFGVYTIKQNQQNQHQMKKALVGKGSSPPLNPNDLEGAFMALLPMLQAQGYNSSAGAAGASSALSAMPASSELQGGLNLRDVVAFLLFVVLGASPLNAPAARDNANASGDNLSNAMVISKAKPADMGPFRRIFVENADTNALTADTRPMFPQKVLPWNFFPEVVQQGGLDSWYFTPPGKSQVKYDREKGYYGLYGLEKPTEQNPIVKYNKDGYIVAAQYEQSGYQLTTLYESGKPVNMKLPPDIAVKVAKREYEWSKHTDEAAAEVEAAAAEYYRKFGVVPVVPNSAVVPFYSPAEKDKKAFFDVFLSLSKGKNYKSIKNGEVQDVCDRIVRVANLLGRQSDEKGYFAEDKSPIKLIPASFQEDAPAYVRLNVGKAIEVLAGKEIIAKENDLANPDPDKTYNAVTLVCKIASDNSKEYDNEGSFWLRMASFVNGVQGATKVINAIDKSEVVPNLLTAMKAVAKAYALGSGFFKWLLGGEVFALSSQQLQRLQTLFAEFTKNPLAFVRKLGPAYLEYTNLTQAQKEAYSNAADAVLSSSSAKLAAGDAFNFRGGSALVGGFTCSSSSLNVSLGLLSLAVLYGALGASGNIPLVGKYFTSAWKSIVESFHSAPNSTGQTPTLWNALKDSFRSMKYDLMVVWSNRDSELGKALRWLYNLVGTLTASAMSSTVTDASSNMIMNNGASANFLDKPFLSLKGLLQGLAGTTGVYYIGPWVLQKLRNVYNFTQDIGEFVCKSIAKIFAGVNVSIAAIEKRVLDPKVLQATRKALANKGGESAGARSRHMAYEAMLADRAKYSRVFEPHIKERLTEVMGPLGESMGISPRENAEFFDRFSKQATRRQWESIEEELNDARRRSPSRVHKSPRRVRGSVRGRISRSRSPLKSPLRRVRRRVQSPIPKRSAKVASEYGEFASPRRRTPRTRRPRRTPARRAGTKTTPRK